MSIDGVSQATGSAAAAQSPATQKRQSAAADAFAEQLAIAMSAAGLSGGGSQSVGAAAQGSGQSLSGLGGLNAVSGIEATLPNGITLGVFRFERGDGAGSVSTGGQSTSADATSADTEMVRELEQMMRDFGYPPSSSDASASSDEQGTAGNASGNA